MMIDSPLARDLPLEHIYIDGLTAGICLCGETNVSRIVNATEGLTVPADRVCRFCLAIWQRLQDAATSEEWRIIGLPDDSDTQ